MNFLNNIFKPHLYKKIFHGFILLLLSAILFFAEGENFMTSIYDISVNKITGEQTTLKEYEGKVILIVNVASKCGFTSQYEGLQNLYEKYKEKGLIVLGFPSNDFLGQEPGSEKEILEFCTKNYNVTFPLFSKITVKQNKSQHPLYKYLTKKETNPKFAGKISWNFNKFLISKKGEIINRFGSRDAPNDKIIIENIEAALKES